MFFLFHTIQSNHPRALKNKYVDACDKRLDLTHF